MKRVIAVLLLITMLLGILIATGCARRRPVDTVAALAQLELAIKYLSEDNFEQAILAFHAVLEIDPKNAYAYKGLAGAYVMQGEPVKAQKILQQGLAEVAEPDELNLVLAGVLLDAGESAQAEEILKELTAVTPIKLSAYRAYTGMLLEQNRREEALQLLQRATAEDEVPYQIYTMLAQIHITNDNTEAALAAIRQSLLINSEQAEAYRQLTQVFEDKPDELITWGIEQHERLLTELANLIAQYIKGEYTEITAVFAQLSEETRANAWVTIILSKAHLRLGENEESLGALNTIDTEQITCAVLLAEIATQYFALGEIEKAIKLANIGIEIDNTVADNYIVLYRIFRDTDEAQARIWLTRQLIHSTYGFIAAKEMQSALIQAVELELVAVPESEPEPEPELEQETEEEIKAVSNWSSVSSGYGYSLAIKTDGTLWAWGVNWNGKLGLGDTEGSITPTQVVIAAPSVR